MIRRDSNPGVRHADSDVAVVAVEREGDPSALSEHVSFNAGYRVLFIHLRDFDHSLSSSRASDEFNRKLAGPLAGLEVRF